MAVTVIVHSSVIVMLCVILASNFVDSEWVHSSINSRRARYRRQAINYDKEITQSETSEDVGSDKVLFDFNSVSDIDGQAASSFSFTIVNNEDSKPPSSNTVFRITDRKVLFADGLSEGERKKNFDYETYPTVVISLEAVHVDGSKKRVKLTIPLSDVNDELPVLKNKPVPYLAAVPVKPNEGDTIYELLAEDPDGNPDIVYSISDQANDQIRRLFRMEKVVESNSNGGDLFVGHITVASRDTFMLGNVFTIPVNIEDRNGITPQIIAVNVDVKVGPRRPQFYEKKYEGSIFETDQPNNPVKMSGDSSDELTVQVRSFQEKVQRTFSILEDNNKDSKRFRIDANGKIYNKESLDYDSGNTKPPSYQLIIKVVETLSDGTALESTVPLVITIKDENDNAPRFQLTQYLKTISEDATVGSTILEVTALDADSGKNGEVTYEVTNDYFSVQTVVKDGINVGNIIVTGALDFEAEPGPVYRFEVKATDAGANPMSSSVDVIITTSNVNDQNPVIQPQGTVVLRDDVEASSTKPYYLTRLRAQDPDGDGVKFFFADSNGNKVSEMGIFRIIESSGVVEVFKPVPGGPNSKDSEKITVIAEDDGACCGRKNKRTAKITFEVSIVDSINQKPTFDECLTYTQDASFTEESDAGTAVIKVHANDNGRGLNKIVSYSIVSPNPKLDDAPFQIDPDTGEITIKTPVDREKQPTNFIQVTVKATDKGELPQEGWCTFRVEIVDINDNPPVFTAPKWEQEVSSNTAKGRVLFRVGATDQDIGDNAALLYSFEDDGDGVFGIYPDSGFIYLKGNLKAGVTKYTLKVKAEDEGKPTALSDEAEVIITITSEEDSEPPKIVGTKRTFEVKETSPVNFAFSELECQSNDENDNRVEFFLVSSGGQLQSRQDGKFYITSQITTKTGTTPNVVKLHVAELLNYEETQQYIVVLRCQNFAALTMYEEVQLTINVVDENDEIPTFPAWIPNGRYQASVQENKDPGVVVIDDILATDSDVSVNFHTLEYSIKADSYPGVLNDFSITTVNGEKAEIRTLRKFNREEEDRYILIVEVNDIEPSAIIGHLPPATPNSATVVVQIAIGDENDNPMVFDKPKYELSVKETAKIGFFIFATPATDPDPVDKDRLLYSFNENNIPFDIRDRTAEIFVIGKLDYESPNKVYMLTLVARDNQRLFSATTTVEITVTDENDNIPIFSKEVYEVRDIVEEDSSIDQENPRAIVTVTATDADISRTDKIRYSLLGDGTDPADGALLFTIDSDTGQIFLITRLDRDKPKGRAEYIFTVEAQDEEVDPQKGYATVKVFPEDINDNKPIFDKSSLVESIREDIAYGDFVAEVKATDYDFGKNAELEYDILGAPALADSTQYFRITKSGTIFTQVDTKYLDRETLPKLEVEVKVTDQGDPPMSATATLTITLTDVNDNAPIFLQKNYEVVISENTKSGRILDVQATDKDVGVNAILTYSIESNNYFKIDTSNNRGYISIKEEVDYEVEAQRHFLLTIYVRDSNLLHVDTAQVNITVEDFNDEEPVFTNAFQTVTIKEGEAPGRNVTTFTAYDKDSGINKELTYTIERSSDPRREFYIDEVTGVVFTRKSLDRETEERMQIIILAIDKGDPQLTGRATMEVVVQDVNDNFPVFKEDYRPVVYENNGPSDLPLEIFAVDKDSNQYGPPFGFALPDNCADNFVACEFFDLDFNAAGDNGDGTATIRTKTTTGFDREQQKYYELPIVMWDMREVETTESQTGTNTLTITIGDVNDNEHYPGHQEVFVYNYKGTFGPLVIGRVYVKDKDDWDLPDKSFTFISPTILQSYFSVDLATGDITMQKGVPANFGEGAYEFKVEVLDKKFEKTVASTVAVTVQDLTEEAVSNSGGIRFKGMTASNFILEAVNPKTGVKAESLFTKFRKLLADKLGYRVEDVEIINLREDQEGGYLEVRYSAHASPYLAPAQLDNVVLMNQAEFEKLGLTVDELPIDECQDEIFEGGCYNKLTVTGQPVTINANGTSYVGVEAYMVATAGCSADIYPPTNECSGDYCHNGGKCVKDNWGNLHCENCQPEHTGARCQDTRHSFDGQSVAVYKTLSQCEDSQTSIEFITKELNGVILYNGPLRNIDPLKTPQDFIILMLRGGYPVLRIDHGTGVGELVLDGKAEDGEQLIQALNDGVWHHIDINRKGKEVEMVLDKCAKAKTKLNQVEDDRACRMKMTTPGVNMYLNVNSLLQLGGVRLLDPSVPQLAGLDLAGFNGCLRNLVHNKQLYDLHHKDIAGMNTGKNGCPQEDQFCHPPNKPPFCGLNGNCEATLNGAVTCTCHNGFWGQKCNKVATIRDYDKEGYHLWEQKIDFFNSMDRLRETELHIMFRTRKPNGALLVLEDTSSSSTITHFIRLMLYQGSIRLSYNLGGGEKNLDLILNGTASNGQWHTLTMLRYGTEFHLKMDNGEGRNYAYRLGSQDSNEIDVFNTRRGIYSGRYRETSEDLTATCIRDVRLDNGYFAIIADENKDPDSVATIEDNPNTKDKCERNDCFPDTCIKVANTVCFSLWGDSECRCKPAYLLQGAVCRSRCETNPCKNEGTCKITDDGFQCVCKDRWTGQLCNILGPEEVSSAGLESGVLIAIIVSIIIILLIAFLVFLLYMKLCRQGEEGEKYILEVDPEDDIRENVMNYDEEGAGEKDQDAYDMNILIDKETLHRPYDPDTRRDIPRHDEAPPVKPDVRPFIEDRMRDANEDDGAPPHDSVREFNFEGGDSDAGSLSSLNTSSSDRSQDYDYLNEWGPKFSKLADMYGAGQDLPANS